MTWTTPRDWTAGELITATIMNTHIRDNMDYLYARPSDIYDADDSADWSITGTSFADIDATDLSLAVTTTGGDLMVYFFGTFATSDGTSRFYLNIAVDGSNYAANDGFCGYRAPSTNVAAGFIGFIVRVTGLSAAAHTITLRGKVSAGTTTLYAGAGTSTADLHPQFGAYEI